MTTTIFSDREIRDGIGGNRRILFRAAVLALALTIGIVLVMSLVQVTRIGAGYVGVEVNLAGSQRGAQDIPVRTGWVFYSPLKTEVIPFPTFVQTVKWTADVSEGHPYNEELVFNAKRDRRCAQMYRFCHLGLRHGKLVAGALGFGDGLRLLRDRLLDRRSEARLADETELLDLHAHRRNLRLDPVARLAQELRFVLAVDVLQLVGGSHLVERVAHDVFQDPVRKTIEVVGAVLHIELRHLHRIDGIGHR